MERAATEHAFATMVRPRDGVAFSNCARDVHVYGMNERQDDRNQDRDSNRERERQTDIGEEEVQCVQRLVSASV